MKKLITTTAILLSAFTFSLAQDGDFKPAAKANNFELNFVPLNGKPIQLTYIRYRRFLSETTALRLGVGLSFSSTKADSVFVDPGNATNKQSGTYKKTQMGWNLRPGFEKHMKGTNRLSPYGGVELDLAGQSSKEVTPTSYDFSSANTGLHTTTDKNKNQGGFFRVGLNVVAGFDCYITKHLYLGSEFGFGFQMVKFSDEKITTSPSPTAPATDPDPIKQGSTFNVGPNFNSSIRLGYIF